MRTIYRYLFIIALFIGGNIFVSDVFANVDVTNSFGFTYDCSQNGGVLHTTFNLGGHHLYNRDYKIDKPGVIQIADASHTTTSKVSNISIDGCNYTPDSCNISTWGNWVVDSSTVSRNFSITTDGSIVKSGTTIVIHSHGNDKTQITGFDTIYNSTGKDATVTFGDNKVTLEENGQVLREVTFTNNAYSGTPEYYYEFSSDNRNIKLKKNIFKRTGNGNILSSSNPYDTFTAFQGTNGGEGASLDSNPDAQGPAYVTGLNYWDYTQHNYTTTKVDVYPVSVNCSETNYSDGSNSNITSDPYVGTLGGITNPIFSGPIKINGVQQQNGSINTYTASGIHLEGLKYSTVGVVGGVNIGVDGIKFTIKQNAFTLGEQELHFTAQTTAGVFPSLDFNDLKDASGTSFTLNKPGVYGGEIILYSGDQNVGTYALPITVVANNTLKIDSFTVSGTNSSANGTDTYANGTDTYAVCSNIVDSFGNPLTTNYDVTGMVSIVPGSFDIDPVASGFQGEGLSVVDPTLIDSKFCFKISSIAPGAENVTFNINIPKHNPDLSANGDSISTQSFIFISFKKLFTGILSVTTPPLKLSLGTVLTMQLGVTSSITWAPEYTIDDFGNQITLTSVGQELQDKQPVTHLVNDNPIVDFRIESTTDAGVNTPPKVIIQDNPIISYSLLGQTIRYRLSLSDSPTDTANLSLVGGTPVNSLKVVGALQGQGKQSLAGQQSNFSDISKSDMRAIIRKNTYTLIRGMTSGQTINGVKYVEGDFSLLGDLTNYETLVVKNGNLTISANFNTTGKKFGIIVLRDDATKTGMGNIYVPPGVRYIQSTIYADGGIISTGFGNDTVGNYKDSAARTSTLSNQLVIKGTLFTRNTIGGAIKGSSGKYILPGGSLTIDFNLAMMYDLNYLRRGNEGYNISGADGTKDYNNGNTTNLAIISNPDSQRDPPKGFKN